MCSINKKQTTKKCKESYRKKITFYLYIHARSSVKLTINSCFRYPVLTSIISDFTCYFMSEKRGNTHRKYLQRKKKCLCLTILSSSSFIPWSYLIGEGNGTPLQYSCLENPMDGGAWWAAVHGVAKSQTRLSDFTFTFHFHALEKEVATQSSALAWRILGMEEPGGLPSTGSHRVGHD